MPTPTTPIVRGSTLVEIPRTDNFNKFSLSTQRTFKGTQAAIESKRFELTQKGYQCVVTQGPLWTLVATIGDLLVNGEPGGIDPLTQWEITFVRQQKNILQSNYTIFPAVFTSGINEMRVDELHPMHIKSLEDWLAKDSPTATLNLNWYLGEVVAPDPLTIAYRDQQYAIAMELYYLLKAGVREVEVVWPVLKSTFQPPLSDDPNMAYISLYDNQILSIDQLVSLLDIPLWVQNVVNTYPDTDKKIQDVPCTYGWLQKGVSITESPDSRLTATVEYHFGLWALTAYRVV